MAYGERPRSRSILNGATLVAMMTVMRCASYRDRTSTLLTIAHSDGLLQEWGKSLGRRVYETAYLWLVSRL